MAKVIGINCLFLIPNEVGGTEYHTRSYIKALQKTDTVNQYVLFCNKENFSTFIITHPRWKKILCPVKARNKYWRLFYEQLVLPFLVKKQKCDILHSFGYFGPVFTFSKRVITLHDLNWRDCPEDFSFLERLALEILIGTNIFTAHLIMSTSEFSHKRFLAHFPNQKNKSRVVLSGVDDDFLTQLKSVKRSRNGKYFLAVSAFYPHKHVLELLSIWEEYVQTHQEVTLVLIGRNGKDESEVLQKVRAIPSVEYHPKVSFPVLVSLYKYAEAFLFSSTYEGFGHPVYEALAAGTRVFVSKKALFEQYVQKYLEDLQAGKMSQGEKKVFPGGNVPRYGRAAQQLVQLYSTL